MLWHNFEINKPIFEFANSVRFPEYLRAIFKSLPPNIFISISASRIKSKVIQHITSKKIVFSYKVLVSKPRTS